MSRETRRSDHVSRLVAAAPRRIFEALLDPEQLVRWLPPSGTSARIERFEPREGGVFRIVLTFDSAAGKSSDHEDVVNGRFVELLPDRRVVQAVEFESSDPDFAGTMRLTWTFEGVQDGTQVAILCEDVPPGISEDDHLAGLNSTLANLADFVA